MKRNVYLGIIGCIILTSLPISMVSAVYDGTYTTKFKPCVEQGDIFIYDVGTVNVNNIDNETDSLFSMHTIYVEDIISNSTTMWVNVSKYFVQNLTYTEYILVDNIIIEPKTREDIVDNSLYVFHDNETVIYNINNTVESILGNIDETDGFMLLPRDADLREIFVDDNTEFTKIIENLLVYPVYFANFGDTYTTQIKWYNDTRFEQNGNKDFVAYTNTELIYEDGGGSTARMIVNFTAEMNYTHSNLLTLLNQDVDVLLYMDDTLIQNISMNLLLEQTYDSNPDRFSSWFDNNKVWFLPIVIIGGSFVPLYIIRMNMINKCIDTNEPNMFCKNPAIQRQKKFAEEKKDLARQLERNM
jgi:hypothetical protein